MKITGTKVALAGLFIAGLYATRKLRLMKEASEDVDITMVNIRNVSMNMGNITFNTDLELHNPTKINFWMKDAELVLKFKGQQVQRIKAEQGFISIDGGQSHLINNLSIKIPVLNVIDVYNLGIQGFLESLSMEVETNVSGFNTTINKKYERLN